MKRVMLMILCVLLLTVPVLADETTVEGTDEVVDPTAAPTDGDSVIKGLLSGWGGTTAPAYYTSSWFWEVLESVRSSNKLQNDLVSGWGYNASTGKFSNPSGYTSSWYSSVLNGLLLIENTANSIEAGQDSIITKLTSIDTDTSNMSNYLYSIQLNSGSIKTFTQEIMADTGSINNLLDLSLDRFISIDASASSILGHVSTIDDTLLSIDGTVHSLDLNFQDYADLWTTDNVTNSNSNSGFGLLTRLCDVLASDIDMEISEKSEAAKSEYSSTFGEVNTVSFIDELFMVFSNFADNDVQVDDLREFFPRLLWNLGNFFTEDTYSQIQDQGAAAVAFSLGPEEEVSDTPYLDAANDYVSSIIGR